MIALGNSSIMKLQTGDDLALDNRLDMMRGKPYRD